ncbi:hypothetical protein [Kitasatospora sp. NPDC093102]|uniref:alpha/beta fold hydrolase n=1 Tax=Kitasatospora sp. NPDC093102 TaxID=3155069 RepID=UPI00341343FB
MTTNTNAKPSPDSPWTGMVPVEDTALAVTDSGGAGHPVVYLNGSYATRKNWRPTIAELGGGYRHITFDERARGKPERASRWPRSGRSWTPTPTGSQPPSSRSRRASPTGSRS